MNYMQTQRVSFIAMGLFFIILAIWLMSGGSEQQVQAEEPIVVFTPKPQIAPLPNIKTEVATVATPGIIQTPNAEQSYEAFYEQMKVATATADFEAVAKGLEIARTNNYTTVVAELDTGGWISKLADWKYARALQSERAINAKRLADKQAAEQARIAEEEKHSLLFVARSAESLVADYKDNEIAADSDYKGKWCLVSGAIDKVGKDIADNAYIAFESEGFRCVQAYFKEAETSQLYALHKGDSVSVIGKCEGLFGNVALKGCRVVPYTSPGMQYRLRIE